MIAPTLDCSCGGSGVCSDCALGDLSNVSTVGASDGDVLGFNGATWEPVAQSGGSFDCSDLNGCSIDDLGDVAITSPENGQLLAFDTDEWVNVDVSAVAGLIDLDMLADVDAPTPADGEVLTWVDADGEWQSVPIGLPEMNLDQLLDVDASSPTDGQVLTFDDGSGDWIAADPAGGGTSGVKDVAIVRYDAGNITESDSSNVKTALPTLGTCVIDAAEGDVIGVSFSAIGFGAATVHDCATIVSAAPVNFISEGNGTGFGAGVGGWYHTGDHSAQGGPLGDVIFYTLQAGDIDSGTCTLQMYYSNDNDGTLNTGVSFQVVNYGQPSPSPSPTGLSHENTVQTGGDQTLDQTSWTALTGLDAVVQAAEGDLIVLQLSGYPNAFSGGNNAMFDIGTIVSAALVNRISGASGNTDFGCLEALMTGAMGMGISRTYEVQAGDVEGGTVTFRGFYRVTSGSCVFTTNSNFRANIQATNIGPAA